MKEIEAIIAVMRKDAQTLGRMPTVPPESARWLLLDFAGRIERALNRQEEVPDDQSGIVEPF